jgi:PH (Pleckstrin Homology) domain-containing protein
VNDSTTREMLVRRNVATTTRVAWLALAGLAAACAVAVAVGAFVSPELADVRLSAVAGAVAAVGMLAIAVRVRRIAIVVGDDGLVHRRLVRDHRFGWDEIEYVRMGFFRHVVTARRGERERRIVIADADEAADRLVDAIVRRAPKLASAAWGLGLVDTPPREMNEADLPRRIHVDGSALVIEGPGENRWHLSSKRRDFARADAAVRERWIARLVASPADPARGRLDASNRKEDS